MKKITLLAALLTLLVAITGCTNEATNVENNINEADSNEVIIIETADETTDLSEEVEDFAIIENEVGTYQTIGAPDAKEIIDNVEDVLILDVRTLDEFNEKHIPDAVLSNVSTINTEAPNVIPSLDTIVLVYCRSGNRSATASQILADMGYTYVYDFGGIIDWPYETVTEK